MESIRSSNLLLLAALASSAAAQTQIYAFNAAGDASSAKGIGDVDADGVPDIAVSRGLGASITCGGPSASSVTVHSGRDGSILRTLLAPPGAGSTEAFGWSFDGIGDVNGDGRAELVVGSPGWSSTTQCGAGRVFVYSGSDGSLVQALSGTGGMPNGVELFGHSVAGAGDVNADGTPDLVVGSLYGLNYNGDASGYARIFSGADWSTIHTLYGNWGNDHFGHSVDGVGDVNQDGRADVIVGATQCSYAGGCGSARVYSGMDGLILYFLNGIASNCSGWSVAGLGDVDGDGTPDFALGGSTAAIVHSGSDGSILRSLPSQGQYYRESVGGAGDVDQDSHQDVFVWDTGVARVFSGLTGSLLYSYGPASGSAASAGDLNNDGHADIVAANTGGQSDVAVFLSACPTPSTYCTAKLNSLGCLPAISSIGVLSLSVGTDNFLIRAVNVRNNQNGLMFWGLSQASIPFGGGLRCVASPLIRTPIQNSAGSPTLIDCSGTYSFHFSRNYVSAQGLTAGTRIYAQFWSRDPGYSPPNNIGATNAITFVILP